MTLSQQGAATALGISKGSVELYERGKRREDGRPVDIPKAIELACAALARDIRQYNGPSSANGPFRVIEVEIDTGQPIGNRMIAGPFASKASAEAEAERLAKRFPHSNLNDEDGYWWGRDPAPSRTYRYYVKAI